MFVEDAGAHASVAALAGLALLLAPRVATCDSSHRTTAVLLFGCLIAESDSPVSAKEITQPSKILLLRFARVVGPSICQHYSQ